MQDNLKYLYENPDLLCEIEFENRTGKLRYIWCEPLAILIELEKDMLYKIVSHDKFFKISFENDEQINLLFEYSFGFKLYKWDRKKWVLAEDFSDIN